MSPSVEEVLARDPVAVECPICRHRQWIDATPARCDQCGSEIDVFAERAAARERVERLSRSGRVVYMIDIGKGLFAVVANRAFGSRSES